MGLAVAMCSESRGVYVTEFFVSYFQLMCNGCLTSHSLTQLKAGDLNVLRGKQTAEG